MSWFSDQWSRWNGPSSGRSFSKGSSSADPNGVVRRVEVVWGRERMQIVLPKIATPTTLGHLKHELHSITSVPYEQLKLIYQGLILKDDRAPLVSFGIGEGSRVILVGTRGGAQPQQQGDKVGAKTSIGELSIGEQRAREKKQKEQDVSEEGLLARIQEVVTTAQKDLFPKVETFERSVNRLLGSSKLAQDPTLSSQPDSLQSQQQQKHQEQQQQEQQQQDQDQDQDFMSQDKLAGWHRMLSELLLRQLLVLDSVQVNSDATRAARKQVVRQVQSHLDRLDQAWSEVKTKGIIPAAM